MFDLPFIMAPGKLVVFEGLDATGKSTQLDRFERSCYAPQLGRELVNPLPMFTHQPSGATGIGPDIYSLTEQVDWTKASPLTRQYLHLAAHSEHYQHDIIPALQERSVWMDRCWWSTVAYGYRGEVADMFSWDEWITFAQVPTRGMRPDVVFLFLERYGAEDGRGDDETTVQNYRWLADEHAPYVEVVPRLGVGETTAFISGKLYNRGLLKTLEN